MDSSRICSRHRSGACLWERQINWRMLAQASDTAEHISIAQNFCAEYGRPQSPEDKAAARGWTSFMRTCMARDKFLNGLRGRLMEYISVFSSNESTRALDHLFAFLGLANDSADSEFDLDYEKPLESIICRYTVQFLRQPYSHNLVLCKTGIGDDESNRFPSWTPDWTAQL